MHISNQNLPEMLQSHVWNIAKRLYLLVFSDHEHFCHARNNALVSSGTSYKRESGTSASIVLLEKMNFYIEIINMPAFHINKITFLERLLIETWKEVQRQKLRWWQNTAILSKFYQFIFSKFCQFEVWMNGKWHFFLPSRKKAWFYYEI